MGASRLWLTLALGAATGTGSASAAQATELTLSPSPAVRCLTPAMPERGAPEYPAREWKQGSPGRVLVELIFTTPDRRPEVKVIAQDGSDDFVDAVRQHVNGLRVPCLEHADIPVRLRQEYLFRPTERGVLSAAPADTADAARQRLVACVVKPEPEPDYPLQALRQGVQGRLLVRMKFTGPDQAPEVTVVTRPASKVFSSGAIEWAAKFRMPCHSGGPVTGEWLLLYRLKGATSYGFRELSLKQFVGNIRDIETQRVFFDFTTMNCPFNVRLTYMQPYLPNGVREIEAREPARQPFLDWLSKANLKLTERNLDAVFGDSVVLAVPCGNIALDGPSAPLPTLPKEKS